MKIGFVIILISFIMLSGFASATMWADNSNISIERNNSANVLLNIENKFGEKVIGEFFIDSQSPFIEAQTFADSISLNNGESTAISMQIFASNDAPTQNYQIRAELRYDNGITDTEFINVNVKSSCTNCGKIEIISYEKNLCMGEEGIINLRVENNTGIFQKIDLSADSELFLPRIEPDYLELFPGESQYVKLLVYSNNSFSEGEYEINVSARSDTDFVQRIAEFKLIECQPTEETLFKIDASESCTYIDKGEKKKIGFTIENLSDSEQEISIVTVSDLITFVKEKNITIEANGEKFVQFEVETTNETGKGKHKIELHAFNADFAASETLCAIVEPIHLFEVKYSDKTIQLKQGNCELFEFTVKNTGDYDEEFRVSLNNPIKGLEAAISTKRFSLDKGEEKTVLINLSASMDAKLGEKELTVLVQNNTVKEIPLTVKIVQGAMQESISEDFLQIISMPSSISIGENSAKTISFTVKNISGQELNDIEFSLQGMPSSIFFFAPSIDVLGENETVEIDARIETAEGIAAKTYTGTILMSANGLEQSAPIKINVQGAQPYQVTVEVVSADQNAMSGLIGLIESGWAGIIGFVILILIVLIVAGLIIQSDKSNSAVAKVGVQK